jgi:CHASE3 domain sensor protein
VQPTRCNRLLMFALLVFLAVATMSLFGLSHRNSDTSDVGHDRQTSANVRSLLPASASEYSNQE